MDSATFQQIFDAVTAAILAALGAFTCLFAIHSVGLWRLAFAVISMTSTVGVCGLVFRFSPGIKHLHMLLQCFSTCIVPLCFVFGTLTTLPGIHVVTQKEQMFMFNMCVSLPLFAYLRKPKPLETLRYLEVSMMLAVCGICVVARYSPSEALDDIGNDLRHEAAGRILAGAVVWLSSLLVDEIIKRMPYVSTLTRLIALLLRGTAKLGASYIFAMPYLPLSSLDTSS